MFRISIYISNFCVDESIDFFEKKESLKIIRRRILWNELRADELKTKKGHPKLEKNAIGSM